MIRSSRSSWRRKPSSNTVGSMSECSSAGRVARSMLPAAGACSVMGSAVCSVARRAVADGLFDAGRGDDVQDRADDGLGRDALRLALEVQDHPMPQRGHRHRADVVDGDVEPAVEQGVDLPAVTSAWAPRGEPPYRTYARTSSG